MFKKAQFFRFIFIITGVLLFVVQGQSQTHIVNGTQKESFTNNVLPVDFKLIREQVALETGMSETEYHYFFGEIIADRLYHDSMAVIEKIRSGEISPDNAGAEFNRLKGRYIQKFRRYKAAASEVPVSGAGNQARIEEVNGPCTNMGFEDGTFTGWTGTIQDRHRGRYNTNAVPPPRPVPGDLLGGYLQHCMMSPGMADPYIRNFSVVPPGKAHSVRLGNTVEGGHVAKIRQTFRVDSSNMVFTYRYAVILEDPTTAAGHDDLNSPHFQANLITQSGDTLNCAKYSVVVESNLSSYDHYFVYADTDMSQNNVGCPGQRNYHNCVSVNRLTNAQRNANNCDDDVRDFYFKDWTTVSIVLDQYLGQNVTIEFSAADCVPDGHLGYAYVHAECAPLNLTLPGFICTGKEIKNVSAPEGFESYQWTALNGGKIEGSANTQRINISAAGTYKVTVVPFTSAAAKCPYEITYTVRNRCAIEKTFCETSKGSGEVRNIDLTAFHAEITGGVATSRVESWHTGLPVNAANKITNPASFTLRSGNYYALVRDAAIKDDTIALTVTVNPSPDAGFNIPDFCRNAPAFQINDMATAGGVFSGPHVSSGGLFNPVEPGIFSVKYKVTSPNGCTDSLVRQTTVSDMPSVSAFGDTVVCYQNVPLNLPVRSTAAITDSVVWTSSAGTPANPRAPSTTISLSGPAPFDRDITVRITSYRKNCPAVSDSIIISTRQKPVITVPADTLICTSGGSVMLPANGSALFHQNVLWSGGNATYSQPSSPQTNVSLRNTYPQKSIHTLVLSAFKEACPVVKDSFTVTVSPHPIVTVQADTTFCENVSEIALKGLKYTGDSLRWTSVGAAGNFSNPGNLNTIFTRSGVGAASEVFVLTVFTAGCGKASDSVTVQYDQSPRILAEADFTCFPDHRVLLSGTAYIAGVPSGGLWSSAGSGNFVAGTASLNNTYIPSAAEIVSGSAILTLTSSGQQYCPAADTTFTWTIVPFPLADAGSDTVLCRGSSVTRSTQFNSDWKYDWLLNPGARLSANFNVGFSPVADTAMLVLKVQNSRQCSATDSAVIVTVEAPVISLLSQMCYSGPSSVTANVTRRPPVGSYFWTKESEPLTDTSSKLDINGPGTYSYNYQYQGCLASASLLVTEPPVLTVSVPPVCEGKVARLEANGIQGGKYYWNNNPSPSGNVFSINAGKGLTNIEVIVEDRHGCRDTATVNVPADAYPTFKLVGTPVCEGEWSKINTVLNNPVFENKDLIFTWYRNDSKINSPSWKSLDYNLQGSYSLKLANPDNALCETEQKIQINSFPNPEIRIPLTYKYCFETEPSVTLTANDFKKYEWYSDNILLGSSKVLQVSPQKDTYYTLKVTNEYGCKDEEKILVRKVCPPRLFVPNVITPHSGDINAALHIFGAHYTNFEITIFSRWGEVIFNTRDPRNAWNGIYLNEDMPIGNYPWIVTYEGDSEEYKGPYSKKGEVTVVR